MKYILLFCLFVTAASCSPEPSQETTVKYQLPEGLKDCKIHSVRSNGSLLGIPTHIMYVVRCPNSATSTSYQQGKSSQNVTVVDESSTLQNKCIELSKSIEDLERCKKL